MARRAAPLPEVMFRCRQAGRQANPATRRKPRLQVRTAGRRALAATSGGTIPDKQGRTPEALQKLVESEVARWTPILKAAGAVAN